MTVRKRKRTRTRKRKSRRRKKKKRPERVHLLFETAQQNDFLKRNVTRNREAIEVKKFRFRTPEKRKRKKEKRKKEKGKKEKGNRKKGKEGKKKKEKVQKKSRKTKKEKKRKCRNDKNGPLEDAHFGPENTGQLPSNVWFSWRQSAFSGFDHSLGN